MVSIDRKEQILLKTTVSFSLRPDFSLILCLKFIQIESVYWLKALPDKSAQPLGSWLNTPGEQTHDWLIVDAPIGLRKKPEEEE